MRFSHPTTRYSTHTYSEKSAGRRYQSGRACGTLLGLLVLLAGGAQVFAQGRMGAAALRLQVRPEVLLQDRGGSVLLKIRLARGATARLWAATSCASPSAESTLIAASGIYTIPDAALEPGSGNPTFSATEVCLASSDGVLHDAVAVEFTLNGSAAGSGTLVAASVAAPTEWLKTTQAGQATWSKP